MRRTGRPAMLIAGLFTALVMTATSAHAADGAYYGSWTDNAAHVAWGNACANQMERDPPRDIPHESLSFNFSGGHRDGSTFIGTIYFWNRSDWNINFPGGLTVRGSGGPVVRKYPEIVGSGRAQTIHIDTTFPGPAVVTTFYPSIGLAIPGGSASCGLTDILVE